MKRLLISITIIGLLGLAAFYFYQKNGGVQEVEFVKLEKLSFTKVIPFPSLKLVASGNAILKNPNPVSAEITKLAFDIYVEGKHTTTINQNISIEMPASSEFKLPIDFEIPLGKAGFFKDAKDILTGAWKSKSLNIQAVGEVSVKVLSIDFDLPFDEEEVYLLKDYLPK